MICDSLICNWVIGLESHLHLHLCHVDVRGITAHIISIHVVVIQEPLHVTLDCDAGTILIKVDLEVFIVDDLHPVIIPNLHFSNDDQWAIGLVRLESESLDDAWSDNIIRAIFRNDKGVNDSVLLIVSEISPEEEMVFASSCEFSCDELD
jgi:hypothetical protein